MEGDTSVQAVTPEGGAPATPATAAPAQTESFINPDGTFKEGWQKQYVPQEFQHLQQIFSGVKTPADMAKMIGNQNATISKQGKGIFVPGPEANQAEKDFFYKAIGRPDKPEDYAFDVPKEMAEWYDAKPESIAKFKAAMHKVGATQEVFSAAKGVFLEMLNEEQQNMIKDPMPYLEEVLQYAQPIRKAQAEAELKTKWGNAYDLRLLEANKIVDRFIPAGEQRDKFATILGDNPDLADIFATISLQLLSEGKGPDTSSGSPAVTNMSIPQRIEKLMSDPNYANGNLNPREHNRLVQEVFRLHEIQSGGKMYE